MSFCFLEWAISHRVYNVFSIVKLFFFVEVVHKWDVSACLLGTAFHSVVCWTGQGSQQDDIKRQHEWQADQSMDTPRERNKFAMDSFKLNSTAAWHVDYLTNNPVNFFRNTLTWLNIASSPVGLLQSWLYIRVSLQIYSIVSSCFRSV